MAREDKGMHFYVILRRETNLYVRGQKDVHAVTQADRYPSRIIATRHMGPNTCVCGPYSDADFGEAT